MWIELHFVDNTPVFVDMTHIVSIKVEKGEKEKTILVCPSGWAFWVKETPKSIMFIMDNNKPCLK